MNYRLLLAALPHIYTKKVFFVSLLSLGIGYYCYIHDIYVDMSSINDIYFIFIVLPLTFILAQAETRRFRVLEAISLIKAQIISMAISYDDRALSKSDNLESFKQKCWTSLINFIRSLSIYLQSDFKDLEASVPLVIDVEDTIESLSHRNEELRKIGVPANEISRLSQYINKIIDNFEIVRSYKYYHTSKIVVIFLEFFVILWCIAFTPYYTWSWHIVGILVWPFIASTFLATINIQKILDHPFNNQDIIDNIRVDFTWRIEQRIHEILFDDDSEK